MGKIYQDIVVTLCEILDLEAEDIKAESYLIQELGAESIDLLELAVTFADQFNTTIKDEDIFLKSLRVDLKTAQEKGTRPFDILTEKYPFLSSVRIKEIIAELVEIEAGPILKVKDLVAYICFQT